MKIGIIYNQVEHYDRGSAADAAADNDALAVANGIAQALGAAHTIIPVQFTRELIKKLEQDSFDLLINLCEGWGQFPEGEAWVAGFLDLIGIGYTGSGPLTLGLTQNKILSKALLNANGLPTPDFRVIRTMADCATIPQEFPVIVKPSSEDGSIGISIDSVATTPAARDRAIAHILTTYQQPALVETYIPGREMNVTVTGNGAELTIWPINELLFHYPEGVPNILNFESKWQPESTYYQQITHACPPVLSPDQQLRIETLAKAAFTLFGCRDYARIDFRFDGREFYILEVNANPDIGNDGGVFVSAQAAGLSYPEMLTTIFNHTLQRTGKPLLSQGPSEAAAPEWHVGPIALFPISQADLPLLHRWFSDPEVARFMAEPAEAATLASLTRDYLVEPSGSDAFFMAAEAQTGTRFGYAAIYDVSENQGTAEISFLIGDAHFRGKGLGTAIVCALTDYARQCMQLRLLTATVTDANQPSLRALLRNGFIQSGQIPEFHVAEGRHFQEILLHRKL